MRLLECTGEDEFALTENFVGGEIPPYAILSHTWQDGQEITLKEFMEGTGKSKTGYNKIRLCGEQTKRDGLQYFWVDTCCIDKSDHVELRESINSMFRWYQNATKCYVYLSDVSMRKRKANVGSSESIWEPAFRASKWFRRGWTLQELLAPSLVEFFSQEWTRLGNKTSLKQQIHRITGIPELALNGAPLSYFSVNERLSWKDHRQTTLEEDKAYSLLGIFGVQMTPMYKEGEREAFRRLLVEVDKVQKCIQDLHLTDPRDDKKRIEETKGGLLKDAYGWILQNSEYQRWRNGGQGQLLWIKGNPGKGKTMLLCGIINELEDSLSKADLLSYFFCQATDRRINNAIAVLRGLLYMLVIQQPSLVSHIRKKHDYAGKALFEDANAWVALCGIFINILEDPNLSSTYLIIDALDECVVDLPRLLNFIARQSSKSPRVRWIISSRNWSDIDEGLAKAAQRARLSLELNAESVSVAVGLFIKQKVHQLSQDRKYDTKTREAVQHHLSSNADGTFLWVALVCQSLDKVPKRHVTTKLNAFPPGLDSLYERMLQQLSSSDDGDICKEVLAVVATLYRPITLDELLELVVSLGAVADDSDAIEEIISHCGSFLTLREKTIYFVHQSAKDFLLATSRNDIFPSGKEDIHHILFTRSLQIMSVALKRDIYDLVKPGCLIDQVKQPDPDPLRALRYSCIYWADHLCDWTSNSSTTQLVDLQNGGIVDEFLRTKYLYWLEAMSLCKSMSIAVLSMAKVEGLVYKQARPSATLSLVQDARRFVSYHKVAIESAPLQAYVSALVFSPRHSTVRDVFHQEAPTWLTIRPAVADKWGACLQTLEGHSRPVHTVMFSHDSTRLASVSYDSTAKIWDTSTGTCLLTLEGLFKSAAFSHDSTKLATVSILNTIVLWDTHSGTYLETLNGHDRDIVRSVVFSYDSKLLVCLLYEGLTVWDFRTDKRLKTLGDQNHFFLSIAFLDSPAQLISVSTNGTVKIWNVDSCECLQMIEGYDEVFEHIAFSHDKTRLASISRNGALMVWDARRADSLQTFSHDSDQHWSVAFSHDSTRLASVGSNGNTVMIFDTSSGKILQKLDGHSSMINSVAFFHDSTWLASASYDGTVKIWVTGNDNCVKTPANKSGYLRSMVLSHNHMWLASMSFDSTIQMWDVNSGNCLQTLGGHSDIVHSAAFSHHSTWLASASQDSTVIIWNTSTGKCFQVLEGHSSPVMLVTFSHDSIRLASVSSDGTIIVWDTNTGKHVQTLEGHDKRVNSVAFSHDSTWLSSASDDCTIKIWDASSGECLQMLEGHTARVRLIGLSYKSTRLASASYMDECSMKIWDTRSGECLQTLGDRRHMANSIAFSRDSAWLASASFDHAVKIWDIGSGDCLQTFDIGRRVRELSFDTTGSYLHTGIGAIMLDHLDLSSAPGIERITAPRFEGWGLSLDRKWVTYNSENLMWLPIEYRPTHSIVLGSTIIIGNDSGRPRIFKFNKP